MLDFILFTLKIFCLPEHKVSIDIDKMNRELIERDRNFYDALESSKWMAIEQI